MASASRVAVSPVSRRVRLRQMFWSVTRISLAVYFGLLVFLYFTQDGLIFVGHQTQGKESARIDVAPAGMERIALTTAQGTPLIALFGAALTPDNRPRPDAAKRPTLLYFYGNGMCLRDTLSEMGDFRRLGLNVLVPDYAGYGMSGGSASETNCYATADAVYAYLLTRKDVVPGKILVGGWSLGAAVAIDLASRKRVAGLVVFSAFTSLREIGQRVFPFIPVSLLLRHRFENAAKMTHITCPALLAHGTADTLVPFAMEERLTAMAAGPITRLAIAGASHTSVMETGRDTIFPALQAFADRL
jgi:fermentation-respiration switch protein FrsA (DUF1100 family)